MRLTEQAHLWLAAVLRPGDIAVDGTVGNGHDTLFLAQAVGATGLVYGLDIQPGALEITRQRLLAAGCSNVVLRLADHSRLADALPPELAGQVAAVVFNLGYLPGGDKQIITSAGSTLQALDSAANLLRPGGLLSVLAYVGHPGGLEEAAAVENWLSALPPQQFTVRTARSDSAPETAPRLLAAWKR